MRIFVITYGISIHALREESDDYIQDKLLAVLISIHALREESDIMEIVSCVENLCISIHALREESDTIV